jgi:hypothetical protein
MATITQRIPHRRRPQIFRDHGYAAIETALAEQEDKLAVWLRHIMRDLVRAIRKTRGRYVGSVHRTVNRSPVLTTRLLRSR